MRLARTVACLACLLLVPASVSAAPSPRQSLAGVLAAARAQKSVHYVALADNGVSRTRLVCDVATTTGIQRITYQRGGRTGKVTVLVNGSTAYIRGDGFILTSYLGFQAAASARFAGKWIRVPQADTAYASIAASATLPSTIDEFRLSGHLSLLPDKKIAGQKVFGIGGTTGQPPAQAKLYARVEGAPLPVGEVETYGKAFAETLLSKWNEQVRISVPAGAVSIGTTGLE
jgi:hypothetical protein